MLPGHVSAYHRKYYSEYSMIIPVSAGRVNMVLVLLFERSAPCKKIKTFHGGGF